LPLCLPWYVMGKPWHLRSCISSIILGNLHDHISTKTYTVLL
jgi:hypothetical protein